MEYNEKRLENLCKTFGDAFYLLDTTQFQKNYLELQEAFKSLYPKFNIAYSYKTNYIPRLCKVVDEFGGYAEVVSDMEMEIAQRIGVKPQNIIWNGPYKNYRKVKELLFLGGTVNLDSIYEIDLIRQIAEEYPDKILSIGIRCNFDIGDGVISRFGFDTSTTDFNAILKFVSSVQNIRLFGLQCHFATRALNTWKPRVEGMLAILQNYNIIPKHIDFGGGLFGKMHESLKAQFNSPIPSYKEYAEAVCRPLEKYFNAFPEDQKPVLLIEPGSALVGDCMRFVSRVVNIKTVRGKAIATVLGSIYNINPTLNKKNPPITILHTGKRSSYYDDLDFGGFTCIESDYLYRHYSGDLAEGDFAIFSNVGSYSVVLKPPFILPNFPVIELSNDDAVVVKRGECFDDLFQTFTF